MPDMPPQPRSTYPGVVLAGGLSRRMGQNKALVRLGGTTMLQHIVARIGPQTSALALNADDHWDDMAGLRHVPDTLPGKLGPLAGILAAMRDTISHHPAATHVLTVPTDAPLLPKKLMEKLAEAIELESTIAVARSADTLHPVAALWPVSLADDLEHWIVTDEKRRVRHFLDRHGAIEVDFPLVETARGRYDPFLNINTPDELAAAETWLEVEG